MQIFKQIYHANLQTNILCKSSKKFMYSLYGMFLTIYALLIEKSNQEMTLVPRHGRSFDYRVFFLRFVKRN